ncbi:TetR family transcriptional regulator [Novosphingobium sp. AAP83]|uniref:TetR/AcrR family transcriptional regulator n=1 Tax=Novosphingobium sp. AAP83 TaxID=1523425 RepID=UPI0006B9EDAD|nr:TetR/AcrR family transcriptional regulator [Novosphingobium sp. AAP83]KPF91126.1 TetR family transcriptional regulator [Novosphingobium sp. AAP83]
MSTPQALSGSNAAPAEETAGQTNAREGKEPRTERGRKTLRKLLDAAALEFGEKGFHESSITGITARAGTALGSFYTYFDSKTEIFQALVKDLSDRVRIQAATTQTVNKTALEAEQMALTAFLRFAREHKEIYRIIDEAEFVDPASYRTHYESTAQRIFERLRRGSDSGEFQEDLQEAHAWAIMGMNVFLGLRYSIWSDTDSDGKVAAIARSLLERGILRREP